MVFEGIVGGAIYGDIALDDLALVNGACGTSPANARPSSLSTTVPPTTVATSPVTATSGTVHRCPLKIHFYTAADILLSYYVMGLSLSLLFSNRHYGFHAITLVLVD